MELTATVRKPKWQDISDEHKRIREQLEESLNKFLSSKDNVPPRAIVGAYGSGKSELMLWEFRKVWECRKPALFAKLEELLKELPTSMNPDELTQELSKFAKCQIGVLKKCLNTASTEKIFLPDIREGESIKDYFETVGFSIEQVEEALRNEEVVLFIDEMEQQYSELARRVKSSGRAPLMDTLESVEHRRVPYYLVISFGLTSAYETLGGAEARRKLDLTIPLPNPKDMTTLTKTQELGNFLWWTSRGRPGWALALWENWRIYLERWEAKPFENLVGLFSQPVDGIPAVNTASLSGLTSQGIDFLKHLILQLKPISKGDIQLESLKNTLDELGRDHYIFVSKELVKVDRLMDAFMSDLRKLYQQRAGGHVSTPLPEMKTRSYLRKILEALSGDGQVAFGGWLRGGEAFVRAGVSPLLILLHDLVLEFEGESSEGSEIVDFLYKLASDLGILTGEFTDYNIMASFPNTRQLFGDFYKEADIEYAQGSFKLVEELFPRLVIKPILTLSTSAESDIGKQRANLHGRVASNGKFLKAARRIDNFMVEFILLPSSDLLGKLQGSLFKPIQRDQYLPYHKVIVILNLDEELREIDLDYTQNADMRILKDLNKLTIKLVEEWRPKEFLISYWYNLYLREESQDSLFESMDKLLEGGALTKTQRRTIHHYKNLLDEKLESLAREAADSYAKKIRDIFPADDPYFPHSIETINDRIRLHRTVENILCSISGHYDRQRTLNSLWQLRNLSRLRRISKGYEEFLDKYTVAGPQTAPYFSRQMRGTIDYIEKRGGFTELLQNIYPKLLLEFSSGIPWANLTESLEATPLGIMFSDFLEETKLLLRALYMTVLLESHKDKLKSRVRGVTGELSSTIKGLEGLVAEVNEFNQKLGQQVLSIQNLTTLHKELEEAESICKSSENLHSGVLYVTYRFLKAAQEASEDKRHEWEGEKGLKGWRDNLQPILNLEDTLDILGDDLGAIYKDNKELKRDILGNVDEIFGNEIETPLKDAAKKVLSGLGSATYELGEDKGIQVEKIDLGPFEDAKQRVEKRISELQDFGTNIDTLASKVAEVRAKVEEVGKLFS